MIDLLVAGGGPAGMATALHARRAGLEVVIVEPRRPPIDKACGEGLMPGAVTSLAELGVQANGQRLAGVRYIRDTQRADARFRHGFGVGMRRTELHAALSAACDRAAIPVLRRAVTDIDQDETSVRAAGVRARYLAAADGLHSPIRAKLGVARPTRTARRWGIRAHFAVDPWTDHVEVYWSERSEAYVTPVAPDCVTVAILTGRRGGFADHLAEFPGLATLLGGSQLDRPRAAGPLRQRVAAPLAGRVLLVGDAAGYCDALTGEGVGVALEGARELVAALAADDPGRYPRAYRAVSRSYRAVTGGLVFAARHPSLRRGIVPAASRIPRVFDTVIGMLSG